MTAVRRLNIAPSEFWSMDPRHFWWLVNDLEPAGDGAKRGGLSQSDKEAILQKFREQRAANARAGE